MSDSKDSIIILSDFEIDKSGRPMTGYSNIATAYARKFINRFHVIAMGLSYRRVQHFEPYGITLMPFQDSGSAIASIFNGTNKKINKVLVFLDIPMHISLFNGIGNLGLNYGGIFAVEGDPLKFDWASELIKMPKRYAISEFGKSECEKAGVKCEHLIVPINVDLWTRRTDTEKNELKTALGLKDKIVFFMNADSNERKNISMHFQALQIVKEKYPNIHFILLTRRYADTGWDYDDLIIKTKMSEHSTVLDRGMGQKEIRNFYVMSDFFLNCSKGEGLGLGLLESMAVGTPVIATNKTAMAELISNNRGIGVEPGFTHIDVLGNTNRYYVLPEDLANVIIENIELNQSERVERAYQYILDRNRLFDIYSEKLVQEWADVKKE